MTDEELMAAIEERSNLSAKFCRLLIDFVAHDSHLAANHITGDDIATMCANADVDAADVKDIVDALDSTDVASAVRDTETDLALEALRKAQAALAVASKTGRADYAAAMRRDIDDALQTIGAD